ncbi:MAG TPA: hypothetical protein VE999_13825 [Gemmataceae bacterium]|nr:hypothetical protein [Gemmataceae bacterium]
MATTSPAKRGPSAPSRRSEARYVVFTALTGSEKGRWERAAKMTLNTAIATTRPIASRMLGRPLFVRCLRRREARRLGRASDRGTGISCGIYVLPFISALSQMPGSEKNTIIAEPLPIAQSYFFRRNSNSGRISFCADRHLHTLCQSQTP